LSPANRRRQRRPDKQSVDQLHFVDAKRLQALPEEREAEGAAADLFDKTLGSM
jgi:hypothetical protein